ncbi:uncharacterized protein [Typha latifolia]|uniref:uncharacterized protein n=1 Tax=Typha latifolia TaxID=4733 RepID=UPI003C2CBE1A
MGSEACSAPLEETATTDVTFKRRGCCWFWAPPWSGGHERSTWEKGGEGGGGGPPATGRWWNRGAKALLKVREWSEILAGPQWKTFIRRLRRRNRNGKGGRFGYDPLSYALNFDDGNGSDDSDEDTARRSFSVRYAAPPVSVDWDTPPLRSEPAVLHEMK